MMHFFTQHKTIKTRTSNQNVDVYDSLIRDGQSINQKIELQNYSSDFDFPDGQDGESTYLTSILINTLLTNQIFG